MSKNKSYKEKMKELRGFVSFNYDLRKPLHPRQKGKINKYWEELQEAKGQPYRVYRPRNKKNLQLVKNATGFGQNLKDFKAAIIPNNDPYNPFKVKIKDDKVILKSKYANRHVYLFNQKNLVKNAEKEIDRVLALIPTEFRKSITAGKFEFIVRTVIDENLKSKVLMLMNMYDNKETNNYWGNWMHGIIGFEIKGQEFMENEVAIRAIYKTSNKKKRKELLKKLANGKKAKKNSNR